MALLCQMYRLLVNLPNFSSCFRNFIKSFIKIFQTSVEYICCEIISADDTASGEAIRYKRLVRIYLINDAIDARLRPPTEILLKVMQQEQGP